MNTATYLLCKKVVEKGNYQKIDMEKKLDTFLLNNRITEEEYNELITLL